MRLSGSIAIAAAALCFVAPALAQQTRLVRIRGTVEAVDLPMLTVKSSSGEVQRVRLADNANGAEVGDTITVSSRPWRVVAVEPARRRGAIWRIVCTPAADDVGAMTWA